MAEGAHAQQQALQLALKSARDRCRACEDEHAVGCCNDPPKWSGRSNSPVSPRSSKAAIGLVLAAHLRRVGAAAEEASGRIDDALRDFEEQRQDQVPTLRLHSYPLPVYLLRPLTLLLTFLLVCTYI